LEKVEISNDIEKDEQEIVKDTLEEDLVEMELLQED